MRKRWKGWLSRALALGLGLVLALGGLEIILRAQGEVPRQRNPLRGFHEAHPTLGWLGVPDYEARFGQGDFDVMVLHDAEGFRRAENPVKQFAPDAVRVAVLGDSFTWGWGVEQGEVFTDLWQTALGPSVELRNFGVNAFGTTQQLALLRELVLDWHPDQVVLMVFGNDLNDNVDEKGGKRPFCELADGELQFKNTPVRRKIAGASRALSRHSVGISFLHYHFSIASNRWKAARKERKALAATKSATEAKAGVPTGSGAAPGAEPPHALPAAGESQAVDPMRGEVFNLLLAEFQNTVQGISAKSELCVAYIPERHEVLRGTPDPRGEWVAASCADLGITFLDLTPILHQAWLQSPVKTDRAGPLYLPHDMHWAPAGHRAAAEALQTKFVFGR